MSKAAIAVWNLSGADRRLAARSRKHDNFSVDPTTGVGGLAGGGDDGSNPGRKMLGRAQLGLEALRDRGGRKAQHISIALVLSDNPGRLQSVNEVVSDLARKTQLSRD